MSAAQYYNYDDYAPGGGDREYASRRRDDRSPIPPHPVDTLGAGVPPPPAAPVSADPRGSRDTFVRETLQVEPMVDARPRSVPPPQTSSGDMLVTRSRGRSPSDDGARSRTAAVPYYHVSRGSSLASSYDSDGSFSDASSSRRRPRRGDRRRRDRGRGDSRSRSRSGSRSPVGRARSALNENFTNSTTGIGASLLGAVVGGFAARTASDAVSRRRQEKEGGGHRRRSDADVKEERIRLASTIIGAVAGGLGANAITNRFEDSRERTRADQNRWESRFGPEEDLPHYDTGRDRDLDHGSSRRALPPPPAYSDDEDYDDRDRDRDRRRRRDDRDDDYDDHIYDRDRRYEGRGQPRREPSYESRGGGYPY